MKTQQLLEEIRNAGADGVMDCHRFQHEERSRIKALLAKKAIKRVRRSVPSSFGDHIKRTYYVARP